MPHNDSPLGHHPRRANTAPRRSGANARAITVIHSAHRLRDRFPATTRLRVRASLSQFFQPCVQNMPRPAGICTVLVSLTVLGI